MRALIIVALLLSLVGAKTKSKESNQEHIHYIVGWDEDIVVGGIGIKQDLSKGGFWGFETSINTAIGDTTLGAEANRYSVNGLLSMNLTFFNHLTFVAKGGLALRHSGMGVDASNEYFNYGAEISLDFDDGTSYALFYYADLIGLGYRTKF